MHERMLQLLSDNRDAPRCFRVEAAASDAATIYLYDIIVDDDVWGGVSAQSFVKELNAIRAPMIHLRIDSPGGATTSASSMSTALREHPARIVSHVDGVAASAASFVMLAADEVEISDSAFVMIHRAMSLVFGNADDLRRRIELLEQADAVMARTYAAETGQSEADIVAWMAAETWFTAQAAVDKGFADRISAAPRRVAAADSVAQAGLWNLAAYTDAPEIRRAVMPAQTVPADPVPDASVAAAPSAPVAPAPAASATVLPVADLAALRRRLALHQRLHQRL